VHGEFVLSWVHKLLGPLKELGGSGRFPPHATAEQIALAEAQLGFSIDTQYRDLLLFSNGPSVGGDGTSVFTSVEQRGPNSFTNIIDDRLKQLKHFPVCTDGCGNDFMLIGNYGQSLPVAFFENTVSKDIPSYLVASDFEHFLGFFVCEGGCSMKGWPFDRRVFEIHDPSFLEICPGSLRPWFQREVE